MRPTLAILLTALFATLARMATAQSEAMTCIPATTITLRGSSAPPRAALLVTFGGRTVGGGVSDSAGRYALPLQIGRERPGRYRVAVVTREARELVAETACVVPGPGAPTALPDRTAAPTVASATATVQAVPALSPTRNPDPAVCDPSYQTVCIPPPPPQLSCADVLPLRSFAVQEPDPHNFDGNNNGIGCED